MKFINKELVETFINEDFVFTLFFAEEIILNRIVRFIF